MSDLLPNADLYIWETEQQLPLLKGQQSDHRRQIKVEVKEAINCKAKPSRGSTTPLTATYSTVLTSLP